MNFLRKLFPSKKYFKNTTSTTNTTNIIETQRIDDENSHSDSNSNVLEVDSTLNNCEGEINIDIAVEHISNDVIHELDSDKTFYVLKNVPPIEIGRNNDVCNSINDDSDKKENEDSKVLYNISEEILNENCVQRVQNDDNESEIKEINRINVVDEVNLQLKEFEDVLVNIDNIFEMDNLETQCSLNSNDLDDILNEIDTANDDLNNEINNNSVPDETDAKDSMDDKKVSNNSEIIDVISINSSIDEDMPQNEVTKDLITIISDSDDSESCEGYHSSDFEFISETEARMDGFIINFRQNRPDDEQFDYPGQFVEELFGDEHSDPGEGTSGQNRPKNEFEDRTYRNNHQIPVGDNYLVLFQGLHNPLMAVSEIYFLENKSVRTSAMNSQYDGMGFDKQLAMRRHQPDSSEDEFADDAKETAGKILNLYPRENRKRRRRR
ncbi:coiled-coil domain-containing protein 1-like [Spodoptera litura]|uniref:Coiled-coil domain-containing protein 1-like n=1 Tax=Spodoptera litura TaxID=69820 RepID=A0A9J7DTT8_SPOLT|nr:coiled-coil domain-containing protein 1-like [Spodoptera litura]